jgi:hypothetical protein
MSIRQTRRLILRRRDVSQPFGSWRANYNTRSPVFVRREAILTHRFRVIWANSVREAYL